MAAQKQDDQLERTFSSYVRIEDVVLKTYLGRWTIGRSGERGSGISVLPARYDDDDEVAARKNKKLVYQPPQKTPTKNKKKKKKKEKKEDIFYLPCNQAFFFMPTNIKYFRSLLE